MLERERWLTVLAVLEGELARWGTGFGWFSDRASGLSSIPFAECNWAVNNSDLADLWSAGAQQRTVLRERSLRAHPDRL